MSDDNVRKISRHGRRGRWGPGRKPEDADEREATSEYDGKCCQARRYFLCTRPMRHRGDHVAATHRGLIVERWSRVESENKNHPKDPHWVEMPDDF